MSKYSDEELDALQSSDEYRDFIYENRRICNGDDLIEALEDAVLFVRFIEEK